MEPGVTSSMLLRLACPVRLFGFKPGSRMADFGEVNRCLKYYQLGYRDWVMKR